MEYNNISNNKIIPYDYTTTGLLSLREQAECYGLRPEGQEGHSGECCCVEQQKHVGQVPEEVHSPGFRHQRNMTLGEC